MKYCEVCDRELSSQSEYSACDSCIAQLRASVADAKIARVIKHDDVLDGRSDEEIRRAARWWFIGQRAWQRGEHVPTGVFAISTKVGLTPDDIAWAHEVIAQYPEWKQTLES